MRPIDACLILGVLYGNSRQVASALRKGANANAHFRKRTVLLYAIQEGHLNIMKALMRAGASLDAKDDEGFIPLCQAVGGGNLELVSFLLKSGANVNGRESSCGTPLHMACAWRHLKIDRVLLAYGADPLARDKDGHTPIDFTKIKSNRIDKAIRKLLKAEKSP